MEDWSIDGQVDVLAARSGTLDEMMDSLASNGLEAFSSTNFVEGGIGRSVQVVPCTSLGSSGKPEKEHKLMRKKILKTKLMNGNEVSNSVSLKKVTFDVEKFAADECDNAEERRKARARLAVRLGARPLKRNYVNYKQLKEELNGKKNLENEFDKLAALKAVKKLSMKKKVKKKLSRR